MKKLKKLFLPVHMGPSSNLISQNNGKKSRDTVPLRWILKTLWLETTQKTEFLCNSMLIHQEYFNHKSLHFSQDFFASSILALGIAEFLWALSLTVFRQYEKWKSMTDPGQYFCWVGSKIEINLNSDHGKSWEEILGRYRFSCLTLNPLICQRKAVMVKAKTMKSAKPVCAKCRTQLVVSPAKIQFGESFRKRTIDM